MTNNTEDARARTAARKARQAIEGVQAMLEYRAAEDALRRRTARLRAERLRREAHDGPQQAGRSKARKP